MKHNGFTLLELIIALALGVFLMISMLQLYLQQRAHDQKEQALFSLQDNARVTFIRLSHDVRMSGLIGCPHLSNVTLKSPFNTSVIAWHQGRSTSAVPMPNLTNLRPDSDVLQIQFVDAHASQVQKAQNNSILLADKTHFDPSAWLMLSDCTHAEAVQLQHVHLRYRYKNDAQLAVIHTFVYYIANTGRTNQTKQPIYALYLRDLNAAKSKPIEFIEGAETMAITLGIPHNGQLDYVNADQVKSWDQVRSLQIYLLLNSVQSFSARPIPYTFLGKHYTPHDRLLRQIYSSVIALRQRDDL